MLINVPQYIDIEDKIVGPLTAKQLGWIIGLGIGLLILWNIVPLVLFFIIGFPLAVLFVALAFFRPYGQPLASFIVFGFMYFFKPKIYVWKRAPQNIIDIPKRKTTNDVLVADKHLTSNSLRDLAQLLDSEGMIAGNDIEKILKQAQKK